MSGDKAKFGITIKWLCDRKHSFLGKNSWTSPSSLFTNLHSFQFHIGKLSITVFVDKSKGWKDLENQLHNFPVKEI